MLIKKSQIGLPGIRQFYMRNRLKNTEIKKNSCLEMVEM